MWALIRDRGTKSTIRCHRISEEILLEWDLCIFFVLVQKEKDSFGQKLDASLEKTGNIVRFQQILPENMSKFRLCEMFHWYCGRKNLFFNKKLGKITRKI